MTPPSQASIDNIYGSMLRGRFEDIPALSSHVSAITAATIELWQSVKARMLPTPSKFHYIFTGQYTQAYILLAVLECFARL